MEGETFVAVHVTVSAADGEMITGLLRHEGIAAHLSHVDSARLGTGPQIFETKVMVPAADAARARELLDEMLRVGAAEAADDARPEEVAPDAPVQGDGGEGGAPVGADAAMSPRKPLTAAAIAFLIPGGGHFYARLAATAIVLEIGMLGCLVALVSRGAGSFTWNAAFVMLFAIVIADSVAGVRAARAHNAGARPSRRRMIARGIVLLALAAAVGTAVAAMVAVPGWIRARRLAPFSVFCDEKTIGVRNGSARDQLVSVDDVRVTATERIEDRWFGAAVIGRSTLRLEAGGQDSVSIAIDPRDAAGCARQAETLGGSNRCLLWFMLTIADLPGATDGASLKAEGFCRPPWGGGDGPRPGLLLLPPGSR